MDDSLSEELRLMFLQSDFVLFASVAILRLHLTHLLEGKHGLLHLSETYIRLALPVITFDVSLI